MTYFMFLNTGINSTCTNLFAKESYCIQAAGDINNYPGRPGYVSVTIVPNESFTGVPFTMLPNATMTLDPRPTHLPLATGVRDDCSFYFNGEQYQYSPDVFGYWNSNGEAICIRPFTGAKSPAPGPVGPDSSRPPAAAIAYSTSHL